MIAHTIQLALTPVFALVAIGNILGTVSTRLGRIVDRARTLQPQHRTTEGREHQALVAEMRAIDRRIVLNARAIHLLVMAALAIGMTVVTLFIEEIFAWSLERMAAVFFIIAITLLMLALTLFLAETRIAAASLRVPESLLELRKESEN